MQDRHYNPDHPLFVTADFGWHNNCGVWVQPSANADRVMVLFAHFQEFRTNEENAKILLRIHQERGYGVLTGGWGDPSKPEALRAYSQVFGVEFKPSGGRVEEGQRIVREWLKAAAMTKGESGLVFSRDCPRRLIVEWGSYKTHEPGVGAHHSVDAVRYFFMGWLGKV